MDVTKRQPQAGVMMDWKTGIAQLAGMYQHAQKPNAFAKGLGNDDSQASAMRTQNTVRQYVQLIRQDNPFSSTLPGFHTEESPRSGLNFQA